MRVHQIVSAAVVLGHVIAGCGIGHLARAGHKALDGVGPVPAADFAGVAPAIKACEAGVPFASTQRSTISIKLIPLS